MQEQQASADSGEGSRQQRKKQRTEDPNTAHTLMDPSLDALRTALAGVDIPATSVPVSSPLPQDTRQQPYAANLLDLQLRGEGAPDECSGCRISRVELAIVSGFFSGLATHQKASGVMSLPVGHAGVELLVESVYARKVQLDGQSVVDLLQAASYLQVQCCMDAVGMYLLEHAFDQCHIEVLRVARSLGLQSMEEQINDRLAARFYEQSPAILARLLHGLRTEAAVQLLLRDDLCCPLECFLLEVLAAFTAEFPNVNLQPLMETVRWPAMTREELRAALHRLTPKVQLCARAAELLCRIADEVLGREHTTALTGQQRLAAKRTLQLMAEMDSNGNLVTARSTKQHIEGFEKLLLKACPPADDIPSHVVLYSCEKKFMPGLQAVFLAVSADGQHHMKLERTEEASWGWYKEFFLKEPLKHPLRLGSGGNMLLLACYVPEQ